MAEAMIVTENVCIWWCEHCGRALEMRSGAPIHIESSTRGCLPVRVAQHEAKPAQGRLDFGAKR